MGYFLGLCFIVGIMELFAAGNGIWCYGPVSFFIGLGIAMGILQYKKDSEFDWRVIPLTIVFTVILVSISYQFLLKPTVEVIIGLACISICANFGYSFEYRRSVVGAIIGGIIGAALWALLHFL